MKSLVPLVNKNGKFEEIEIEGELLPMFVKHTVMRPRDACFVKWIGPADNCIAEVNIKHEHFELKELMFKIDEIKYARTVYYVSTDFLGHLPNHLRKKEIEKFGREHAAWIFTYGERRNI